MITVIIVSSPSQTHPSTYLIDSVIQSLEKLNDIRNCRKIFIYDGYVIKNNVQSKRGIINHEIELKYKEHIQNIKSKYCTPEYDIHVCQSHHGYALCVKKGLELCTTPYAFILQHDRIFTTDITNIHEWITTMEKCTHIRYIGLPTTTSRTHAAQILYRYQLTCFTTPKTRISLSNGYCLQPLLFWFDSNHFAHVERYLQIYKPFMNISTELKSILSRKQIKQLVLRPGDFIEDRFGQMQRKILTTILVEYFNSTHKLKVSTCNSIETEDCLQLNTHPSTPNHSIVDPESVSANNDYNDNNDYNWWSPHKIDKRDDNSCNNIDENNLQQQQLLHDLLIRSFQWFGSYLLWYPVDTCILTDKFTCRSHTSDTSDTSVLTGPVDNINIIDSLNASVTSHSVNLHVVAEDRLSQVFVSHMDGRRRRVPFQTAEEAREFKETMKRMYSTHNLDKAGDINHNIKDEDCIYEGIDDDDSEKDDINDSMNHTSVDNNNYDNS